MRTASLFIFILGSSSGAQLLIADAQRAQDQEIQRSAGPDGRRKRAHRACYGGGVDAQKRL